MKKLYLILLSLTMLAVPSLRAFDTSAYADASVLASGKWVKIAVETDGLYLLTNSRLKSWGFTDPSKVVIRGYGARVQSDVLSLSNYTDDLPAVQSALTDKGIVFYGVGSGQWTESTEPGMYWFKQNPYSKAGYYFVGELADGEEPRELKSTASAATATAAASSYLACVHHELERTSPGEAGPLLVGEDFKYNTRQKFNFSTPGAIPDQHMWMQTSFVSCLRSPGENEAPRSGKLQYSFNGVAASQTTSISLTDRQHTSHAKEDISRLFFTPEITVTNPSVEIEVALTTTYSPEGAWLNYISLNYYRRLELPAEGYLCFATSNKTNALDTGGKEVTIWDVSDPANIAVVVNSGGTLAAWEQNNYTRHSYAAWTSGATLPEPALVGTVAAQNLHALSGYDMVIVSPSAYVSEAQRLADFHAGYRDKLNVAVVNVEHIYNEFSSGATSPGAIRRFFKMLYDRGNAADRPLKYVILMGRPTIDPRGVSNIAPSYPTVPAWMPLTDASSLTDNSGYSTDDILVMLEDGSGASPGWDKLSIAAGRIPVTSLAEARDVVDKIMQYATSNKNTAWKQRYLYLADDGNQAAHLTQSEWQIDFFNKTAASLNTPIALIRKIYIDAYTLVGSEYPEAKKLMNRYLEDGVVWWNFIGHASTTGWTAEHMLSYTDLNNMYLTHWPFIYAATCNFLRIDGSVISGGEIMFKERYGGAIGMVSAVRPVYIANNGNLSAALGRAMALRDDKGRPLTPGEIMRRAKNDYQQPLYRDNVIVGWTPSSDTNRLRYFFIGDPALALAVPDNIVRVDSIKGVPVGTDGETQHILGALEQAEISGCITDAAGNLLPDFNGVLLVDILDAERTITTNGRAAEEGEREGKVCNYEDYGDRIYTGSAKVVNGRFTLNVSMPMEISQNFRPATMGLYAYSSTTNDEAAGCFRDFYAYGFNESGNADTEAPVIEKMYLNHEDFRNGDMVNVSPMLIAKVSDNVGINVSTAGIGHQMTAILDKKNTLSGISNYYTPDPDEIAGGVLNYPIENMQPGPHTLTLRIWDTAGNSAESSIDFTVSETVLPKIFDIWCDASPASTQANFYLKHDRPDQMLTVTVTVYNMLGKPLWSNTVKGVSDMFTSVPVTWDLTDTGGRRVPRGIYLYRASISTDGENFETATRRLPVTAQ